MTGGMNGITAERISTALATANAVPTSDFDLNADQSPTRNGLTPAAVLIGLHLDQSVPSVLLTKRSSQLKDHPGQVAFPGGKVDETDASPLAAALREAHEEVGLPSQKVKILGQLPSHQTVTGFDVMPFVANITEPFEPIAEAGEVAEVFTIPLHHALTIENFKIEGRMWHGKERRYYTAPFGPYYLWGATARIMRLFAEIIHAD